MTRGLVCSLARLRLTQQATRVYRSAVQWDSYSRQANTRPLNIRLTSDLTMEEIFVIVTDFLARLNTTANMNEKLNIFIKVKMQMRNEDIIEQAGPGNAMHSLVSLKH